MTFLLINFSTSYDQRHNLFPWWNYRHDLNKKFCWKTVKELFLELTFIRDMHGGNKNISWKNDVILYEEIIIKVSFSLNIEFISMRKKG